MNGHWNGKRGRCRKWRWRCCNIRRRWPAPKKRPCWSTRAPACACSAACARCAGRSRPACARSAIRPCCRARRRRAAPGCWRKAGPRRAQNRGGRSAWPAWCAVWTGCPAPCCRRRAPLSTGSRASAAIRWGKCAVCHAPACSAAAGGPCSTCSTTRTATARNCSSGWPRRPAFAPRWNCSTGSSTPTRCCSARAACCSK